MLVFGAIFTFIGRQVGRIANVLFGWATTMLFGKVPSDKQIWLSVVALGSLAWLAVALGVIFPTVGLILLSFVPSPKWLPGWVVRTAMIVAFFLIPLLVGIVAGAILPASRPHGWHLVRAVLRGYPYTAALAVTMVLMIAFVPFLKVPSVVRRWKVEHMPVIISPNGYEKVVHDLHQALRKGGIETVRRPAPGLLRLPPEILARAAGGGLAAMVAGDLTTLENPVGSLRVIVYPSDLMVQGEPDRAETAIAVMTRELVFTDAHLTWTKEANAIEDRLRTVWEALRGRNRAQIGQLELEELRAVEQQLARAHLPYEEWRILYREKLQVTERVLTTMVGLTETATSPSESSEAAKGITIPERPTAATVPVPTLLLGIMLGGLITTVAAGLWLTKRGSARRA